MSDATRDFFETLAKVLLRCWIIGFVLLFIWSVAYMNSGRGYEYPEHVLGLSRHEWDLMNYCGMGLVKLCVFVFFFVPWVAIRLVLRKAK